MTPTLHPTEAGLLRAVCEDPADDEVRGFLLEWLEENGQPERVEFIRVQVRIADLNRELDSEDDCDEPTCACAERVALRRRERELFNYANIERWFTHGPWLRTFVDEPCFHSCQAFSMLARRGFVAFVSCTLADWCGQECSYCHGTGEANPGHPGCYYCPGTGRVNAHGPAIVQAAPIEKVTVSDRRPAGGPDSAAPDGAYWWEQLTEARHEDFYTLPAGPFGLLGGHRLEARRGPDRNGPRQKFYASHDLALDALSRSALAWARRQAGLPALS
jgi:uncharacterized protein (TIGR02996 family)